METRSSLWYSSFGEMPIFRCSSFTVSENADVAASYFVASRFFSSQLTLCEFYPLEYNALVLPLPSISDVVSCRTNCKP
jgi:hypothetical protein